MEKVKLIQGNTERAEEIKKTLKEWGGVNKINLSFGYEDNYYYLDQFCLCRCIKAEDAHKFVSEGKAEIYELPHLKPKCKFKPFEKVLVRNVSDSKWNCDLFSYYDYDGDMYVCIAYAWKQCIQYEGNEHLLGTNDNQK